MTKEKLNDQAVSEKAEKTRKTSDLVVEVASSDFKELSELNEEEIKKLGKVNAIIRRVYYKRSKREGYEIEVKLHEYLTVKNSISRSEYYLYLISLGLDPKFAEHTLRIPCRFVTGINKNGNAYHQIELIFGKDLYFGNLWLNGPDLKLFKMLLPNVTVYKRDQVIDEETMNQVQYYEE